MKGSEDEIMATLTIQVRLGERRQTDGSYLGVKIVTV
jgi:hypothetical protein